MLNTGRKIAELVYDLLRSSFGEDTSDSKIILRNNEVMLTSQYGKEFYLFRDNGLVDSAVDSTTIKNYMNDCGVSELEAKEDLQLRNYPVLDLLAGKSDLLWFGYLNSEKDYTKVVDMIKIMLGLNA